MPTQTSSTVVKLEHQDHRGEIYSIQLPDNRELMLLRSVAGIFRGGHSHSCDEIVALLTGKMRYHKLIAQKTIERVMKPGDVSYNPAGQIHMGEFLEESWVVEFKLAKKGEWMQENYPPFREKVEAA